MSIYVHVMHSLCHNHKPRPEYHFLLSVHSNEKTTSVVEPTIVYKWLGLSEDFKSSWIDRWKKLYNQFLEGYQHSLP